MARIAPIMFVVLSLVLLSACVQDDATTSDDFATADGNLVTSATYNVDGNIFEVEVTVVERNDVDIDALISTIEVVRGTTNATTPDWMKVDMYAMTEATGYAWQFKTDNALYDNFDLEADTQITEATRLSTDWTRPGLDSPGGSASVDYKPETKPMNNRTLDLEHPFFDPTTFDPDDYFTETVRPRRKKHHKKHH